MTTVCITLMARTFEVRNNIMTQNLLAQGPKEITWFAMTLKKICYVSSFFIFIIVSIN